MSTVSNWKTQESRGISVARLKIQKIIKHCNMYLLNKTNIITYNEPYSFALPFVSEVLLVDNPNDQLTLITLRLVIYFLFKYYIA